MITVKQPNPKSEIGERRDVATHLRIWQAINRRADRDPALGAPRCSGIQRLVSRLEGFMREHPRDHAVIHEPDVSVFLRFDLAPGDREVGVPTLPG